MCITVRGLPESFVPVGNWDRQERRGQETIAPFREAPRRGYPSGDRRLPWKCRPYGSAMVRDFAPKKQHRRGVQTTVRQLGIVQMPMLLSIRRGRRMYSLLRQAAENRYGWISTPQWPTSASWPSLNPSAVQSSRPPVHRITDTNSAGSGTSSRMNRHSKLDRHEENPVIEAQDHTATVPRLSRSRAPRPRSRRSRVNW